MCQDFLWAIILYRCFNHILTNARKEGNSWTGKYFNLHLFLSAGKSAVWWWCFTHLRAPFCVCMPYAKECLNPCGVHLQLMTWNWIFKWVPEYPSAETQVHTSDSLKLKRKLFHNLVMWNNSSENWSSLILSTSIGSKRWTVLWCLKI